VQDHVHAGQTGGGRRNLLPVERDLLARFGGHLEQQRAGAASGIVGGGLAVGVVRANADQLGDGATDLRRRVELAFALA
jgi:hypothetical protein